MGEDTTTDDEVLESQAHGHFKPLLDQDIECKHHFWIKRCSMCRAIMESDAQRNVNPGDSMRISYGPLDTLVCTLKLSQQLKSLQISQRSKLYWVLYGEEQIVSLRTFEECFKIKNAECFAAFTSSELCKHLYRLPKKMQTPSHFQYVGRNAHDPNRLARLLLKQLN